MRRIVFTLFAFCASVPCAAQFDYKGDFSIRVDDTSARSVRSQYRLRFSPQYEFGKNWSVHGFVATGDEYDSAYNTIDENDDHLHVRRLFARYARGDSRLEAGLIPPYKGRVSSTGLSKEGWIRGVRGVWGLPQGEFEIVVGDLEDLRASRTFSTDYELSYVEVEYAGKLSDTWTYEIGGEELFDDRFVRGELRYLTRADAYWALELIYNASEDNSRVILSTSREIERPRGAISWFTYYSYTGSEFGPRAELSEDFLEFGHAIATKLKGAVLSLERLEWFAEVEFHEETARIKAGFEFSLD